MGCRPSRQDYVMCGVPPAQSSPKYLVPKSETWKLGDGLNMGEQTYWDVSVRSGSKYLVTVPKYETWKLGDGLNMGGSEDSEEVSREHELVDASSRSGSKRAFSRQTSTRSQMSRQSRASWSWQPEMEFDIGYEPSYTSNDKPQAVDFATFEP